MVDNGRDHDRRGGGNGIKCGDRAGGGDDAGRTKNLIAVEIEADVTVRMSHQYEISQFGPHLTQLVRAKRV